MRYFKEIRWRLSSDAAKAYLGVARKVLQGLLDRVSSAGVKVGARTVTLEDGTVVRVLSVGNVPIVEIKAARDTSTPPESVRECSMFMESGQLNLGATVASLATDSAATITFNTRTAHNARFNGEIKVQEINGGQSYRVVDGAALPDDGSTTVVDDVLGEDESVLVTRAAKKTAQFLLPASCWSGLMRRFVQAKYGFPGAVYGSVSASAPSMPNMPTYVPPSSATPALQVTAYDGVTPGTLEMNFRNHQTDGIVDLGLLDLWFVRILPYNSLGGQKVEFRRALYTDCADMLRKHLIKIGRAHPDFKKLSTFMLSQTFPSLTAAVTRDLPEDMMVAAVGPYGWKFNARGTEAAIVSMTKIEDMSGYVRSADFVIHQMTFSYNVSDELPDISISSSSPVEGWRCGYYQQPLVYSPLHAFRREGVPGTQLWETEWAFEEPPGVGDNFPTAVFDCDYPVYCWYEDNTLVVVRRDFATDTPSGQFVSGQCLSELGAVSGVYAYAGGCPCTEHPCLTTDVSCDSATTAYTRVVRDGYYTTYHSSVALHTVYPLYDPTVDVNGQAGYGWLSRGASSDEHVFGGDVATSDTSSPGHCTEISVSDCTSSTTYTPTQVSAQCYPVGSPPVDSGSCVVDSLQKTADMRTCSARDAADTRFSQFIVPQYDASSGVFKDYTLEGSKGSATNRAGCTFSEPYSIAYSSSGSTFVPDGLYACPEGPGYQMYYEYENTFADTHTAYLCLDDLCYDDSPENDTCEWEDCTTTSQSYTRMDETLRTFLAAGGTAMQLDDITNAYVANSGSVAALPSCNIHWNPPGAASGSPLKSTLSGSTWYVDTSLVSPEFTALAAIARVWQSDGGDFASSESLQYRRLENAIQQHAGYSVKTQELFSFIGWA